MRWINESAPDWTRFELATLSIVDSVISLQTSLFAGANTHEMNMSQLHSQWANACFQYTNSKNKLYGTQVLIVVMQLW